MFLSLLFGHKIQIHRKFHKYWIFHHQTDEYLSMEADQELPVDQLPAGHTPVWIQPPGDATQVQMLENIEKIVNEYEDSVMVLYRFNDERAAAWCIQRGWDYQHEYNIYGCEARCVVLLECGVYSEFITRGINLLIILSDW